MPGGGKWEGRREERKRGEYGRVLLFESVVADGDPREKKTKEQDKKGCKM